MLQNWKSFAFITRGAGEMFRLFPETACKIDICVWKVCYWLHPTAEWDDGQVPQSAGSYAGVLWVDPHHGVLHRWSEFQSCWRWTWRVRLSSVYLWSPIVWLAWNHINSIFGRHLPLTTNYLTQVCCTLHAFSWVLIRSRFLVHCIFKRTHQLFTYFLQYINVCLHLHVCTCIVNCDKSSPPSQHDSEQDHSTLHPRQNIAYLLISLNILYFPTIHTPWKALSSLKWSLPCKAGSYLNNQFASRYAARYYIPMFRKAFNWTVSWTSGIHSTFSQSIS